MREGAGYYNTEQVGFTEARGVLLAMVLGWTRHHRCNHASIVCRVIQLYMRASEVTNPCPWLLQYLESRSEEVWAGRTSFVPKLATNRRVIDIEDIKSKVSNTVHPLSACQAVAVPRWRRPGPLEGPDTPVSWASSRPPTPTNAPM